MNGVPPLEFAGVSHWAALAVLLAAGACILELGQSYKKTVRNRTTFWLGAGLPVQPGSRPGRHAGR